MASKPLIGVVGLTPPPLQLENLTWVHYPLIATQPASPMPDLTGYDWLFWTSKQAVLAAAAHMPETSQHATLGPAETTALNNLGLNASWQSPVAVGVEAAQALAAYLPLHHTILWPCGNRANPDIRAALCSQGHNITQKVVYQTLATSLALPTSPVHAWLFTSPSAVEAFVANQWVCAQPTGALGPSTAAHITKLLGVIPQVAQPSGHWASVLNGLAKVASR